MNPDPNGAEPEFLPPDRERDHEQNQEQNHGPGHESGFESGPEFGPESGVVFAPLPPMRFPNMADVGLLFVLLILGGLVAAGVTGAAFHFHLFGVFTSKQALSDIHYTLGSQSGWYFSSLIGCLTVFPLLWHKSFFAGDRAGACWAQQCSAWFSL